ncbi:hypothetical protein J0H58_13350 [bacterium]|nr:hypothetical protein [bacterium]
MAATATHKKTSARASTQKGKGRPADLDVHKLFASVEKKVGKLNLPNLTARDLIFRYLCECGEDTETILLDWIEAVGYLDNFREFLDGQLAEAKEERRASEPIPADVPLAEAWERFRERVNYECGVGDLAHFIDNHNSIMDETLLEVVEVEGLEQEVRDWMNWYLGHGPKKKAA